MCLRGLALASLLLVGCANVDRRFLRGAQIEQVGVAGECRVAPGAGVVLLLRSWDGGKMFSTDDERYRKLTIELPAVVVGRRVRLGDPGVRVVISDGSTAWDVSRCGSETGTGSILVTRLGGRDLTADIALVMDCRYARSEIPADTVRIDGTFQFGQIAFDDMSPWLDGGVNGRALYER